MTHRCIHCNDEHEPPRAKGKLHSYTVVFNQKLRRRLHFCPRCMKWHKGRIRFKIQR